MDDNSFFSTESKFYKVASIVGNMIILGLIWMIFSIPVITIGSATTAAYYVATKRVSGSDGYMLREFLKSFSENFKVSTIIFVILAAILTLMVFNITFLMTSDMLGNLTIVILAVQFFITVQALGAFIFVFPLVSRFEHGVIKGVKTALMLANKHFMISIQLVVMFVAIMLTAFTMPAILLFAVGIYIYISSYYFVKVFKKYEPDFDKKMTDDDLKPLDFDKDETFHQG